MTPIAHNIRRINSRRHRVHGKWIAYAYGNSWQDIDPAFRNDGSAFVSDRGPLLFHAPHFADGAATLVANNYYDIFNRSYITTPDMEFEATPEGVRPNIAGRIDEDNPSQVWYDDAWGLGLSLRYTIWYGRAPRATREAVIDPARCPRGRDLQASWLVRSPRALTLINGMRPKNPDGSDWTGAVGDTAALPETGAAIHYYDGQVDPVRGSGFKGPQIWYWTTSGELVTQPATVTATIVDASTIRMTKTVPEALVDAAAAEGSLLITDDVQTIYPDPNAESTTFDGHTAARHQNYDSTNYPTTVALAATSTSYANDQQTTSYIGFHFGGGAGGFFLERFYTLFDLTALAGNTVSAATQGWTVAANATSKTFRVTGATTASNTGYSLSDHLNTYNNHDSSYSDDNPGFTPLSSVATMDYNATGLLAIQSAVDGSGIFKSCLRRANDNQSAPADGQHDYNQPTIHTAEATGSTNDPYLEVTYSAAPPNAGDPTVESLTQRRYRRAHQIRGT